MPLPDGETLLAKTAARALALPGVAELVTVTNRELLLPHEGRSTRVGHRGTARTTSFLLEPFGRNTAPAVALAALGRQRTARRRCGAAGAAGRPSDPRPGDAFAAAVARAACARARRVARDVRHRADAPRDRDSATSNAARRSPALRTSRPRFARAVSSRSRDEDVARVRRRRQLRLELRDVLLHRRRRSSPRSRATRRSVARRGAAVAQRDSLAGDGAMLEIDAELFAPRSRHLRSTTR